MLISSRLGPWLQNLLAKSDAPTTRQRRNRRGRLNTPRMVTAGQYSSVGETLEDRTLLTIFTVTTLADVVNSGDGVLSLREAVTAANSNGIGEVDEIVLSAGTYTLSLTGAAENANASGDMDLDSRIVLRGAGREATTITAETGFNQRILQTIGGNDMTIQDLTISGGRDGLGAGISVAGTSTSDVTLQNVRLTDNIATTAGGGLHVVSGGAHVTVQTSDITLNQAPFGAGIYNGGTLTVDSTSIATNTATSLGGGIYAQDSAANTRILASTLSGNMAPDGAGITNSNATLSVINSTVSGNQSTSQVAGGILNLADGAGNSAKVIVLQSTVYGNLQSSGGAIHTQTDNGSTSAPVQFGNTILAGIAGGTRTQSRSGTGAVFTSLGSNIASDTGAGGLTATGDQINIAVGTVLDAELSLNGGPTRTHALKPDSPAKNAGDVANAKDPGTNAVLEAGDVHLTTDQRDAGYRRVSGGAVDIGAFELQFVDPELVTDLLAGAGGSSPSNFVNVNGTLFFTANDGANGVELWRSDGTSSGTTLVKDIRGGSSGSDPTFLTNVNGTLFFRAFDGVNGYQLWHSDGTFSGTTLVKDILGGSSSSLPRYLTNVNGTLFFSAFDGVNGYELWSMRVNSRPQLTAFAAAVKSTNQNTQVAVTFADLVARGDESDVDGTVDAFIVQAVSSGSLKIGTTAGSATAFAPGSNDRIDATLRAYWTPATNVNGDAIAAFTVVAQDDIGDNSILPVTVAVDVTPPVMITITGPGSVTQTQRPEITWSAAAGAASYEVWITNLSTGTSPFHQATPTGTSYIPTVDLGIGKFQVWVRSKASNGSFSSWSAPHDFQITTRVTVNALNPVQTTFRPTISWGALPGADHYDVWFDNLSTGAKQVVRNMNVAGTSFQVPSNLALGSYRAWVSGVAADGFAATWSAAVNFGISVAPTVTQGQNASFNRTPVLRWNSLPGSDHYDVWINNLSTGASQVVRNMNVTSTTFTGPTTLPIGRYRAWVRGIAADGFEGAWTPAIHFSINGAPVVTQGQNTTFDRTPTFAWNAQPGAAVYEVFLRNLSTGALTLYNRNVTATQFTPPTLTDCSYRWWTIGVTAQGFRSLWTAPMDIYVGGRPSFLTPSGSTTDTTPTFSWRPVDGAVRYDLWVDRVGGANQIIRQQSLTSPSLTPTTALAKGSYRAWVRAVSSTGEISLWSAQLDFTIVENRIDRQDENALLPLLTSVIGGRRLNVEFAGEPAAAVIVSDQADTSYPIPCVPIDSDVIPSENVATETDAAMLDAAITEWMLRSCDAV